MQVLCKNPSCYKRDVPTTIPDDGLCCPYCGNAYAVHGVDLREARKAVAQSYKKAVCSMRQTLKIGFGALFLVAIPAFAMVLQNPTSTDHPHLAYTVLAALWTIVLIAEIRWLTPRATDKKIPPPKLEKGETP